MAIRDRADRAKGAKAVKAAKAASPSAVQQELVIPVSTWRYAAIGILFGGIFIALLSRAVYLQVIDADYLQSQGNARYLRVQKEVPTRGMVVDRNDQPLAISTPVDSIWIHPSTILEQQALSQATRPAFNELAKLVGVKHQRLLAMARNKKARQFVYLKRHLSPQVAEQIMQLKIPGVNRVREYKRYYPAGPVLGHVLGFVNIDNEGQEGLELAYDRQLKGLPGRTQVLQDKNGQVVEYVEQLSRVQHGQQVKLSIDARIQYLAYRHLQAALKLHQASTASLVALDAKTGEILAMVSAPDFNPNDRTQLRGSLIRNRSIADSFEPGSTMKPFSVAMVLDEGKIAPDSKIETDPGYFYVGSDRINDTKNHGEISVSEVIKKSSNIGAAKIAMMMRPIDLYDTYRQLGFGETNGLALQGEQRGILAKRKSWKPIEHATLSYGYGLSVNTLQLARAYQALANDGVMLPVSLHPLQQVPQGKRVFSSETVQQVNHMLELAVSDEGTAPKARVDQYRVAGKTGTAHRVVNGQYQDDSYTSLFAGFAPVSDPQIVLVVTVTDPKSVDYYGGLVAAPVFSSVMRGALRFRNVAPDAVLVAQPDAAVDEQLQITRSPQWPGTTEQGAL